MKELNTIADIYFSPAKKLLARNFVEYAVVFSKILIRLRGAIISEFPSIFVGILSHSSPLGIHFRVGQHRTPYHEFCRLYV